MKNISLDRTIKEIILGAAGAFALSSAYFIFIRRKKHKTNSIPKVFKEQDLTMERYVFSLPTENGQAQAVVEQGGECYAVHLDGKYMGNMWRDEQRGMKWNTMDDTLQPYVLDIADHLSEAFSRKGFPSLLMGTYPEILSTDWKSSETLEVVINEETDIEVFSTFLKDEVSNLGTFEEHLDLMVKRNYDSYFVLIGIN